MDKDTKTILKASEKVNNGSSITPELAAEFAKVLRECLGLAQMGIYTFETAL